MPKSKSRNKKRERKMRYPFVPATEDKYILIDDGPVTFVSKVTGTIQNEATQTLAVKSIPIEDSIRPVELKFQPPLQQDGTDPTCFDYQWQQLTYLFELDDPSGFVNIRDSLGDEDKQLLIRYVKTCRNLAGYSVINAKNGLKMSWGKGDTGTIVRVDLPSHEEFSGFSATFRQLHNDGEGASFNKAWKIVSAGIIAAGFEETALATVRATLKTWRQARARLMEKAASTLIAEKLNANLKPEHPRPLKGIVPEDLIRQFNYGDTLHWGDQREKLAALNDGDPFHASYNKYCCASTMTSLAHLYFGFALLVAAALGVPYPRQDD